MPTISKIRKGQIDYEITRHENIAFVKVSRFGKERKEFTFDLPLNTEVNPSNDLIVAMAEVEQQEKILDEISMLLSMQPSADEVGRETLSLISEITHLGFIARCDIASEELLTGFFGTTWASIKNLFK